MLILTALRWLWAALVTPWLGPALLRVLPFLAPLGGVLKAWAPAIAALVLVAVFAAGWWIARPTDLLTREEAQQACEDASVRAELAATKKALGVAQETLRQRAAAIAAAERWIEDISQEMEALRAAAPDPDDPVFAADDPWLRGGAR